MVSLVFSGPLLLGAIALSLVYYLATCFISYRRLSHIPGPSLWGWSILPLFRLHAGGDIYNKFGDLALKYGPLVRIGPNYLLASDPEVHRRMAAPRSPYTRSTWYRATRLTPGVDNLISELDEDRHNDLRKRMAAGFAGKENSNLEADIDGCILDLVNLIGTKYATENASVPMEFARKVQYFTSDIMSQISFDAKFHDLRDDNDNHGYIHEVETIYPNIFPIGVIPEVIDFLTKLGVLDLLTPSEDSKLGFGKVQAITKAQIATRFDSDGKPKDGQHDMLGSFIRHGLTEKELEQETILQL
jgi:hypothetical protein